MLLRTYALWGRSRIILIFLSVLLAISFLGASGQALYTSLTVVAIPSPQNIRPCLYNSPNADIIYGVLACCIVYDSAIIILTLIKTVPARKCSNGLTPLLALLLKDGIQFFLLIFLIAIANIVMISRVSGPPAGILLTFYEAMASTIGSRLVLNLRGSILQPAQNHEDTTLRLNTLVFNRHLSDHDETILKHDLVKDLEDLQAVVRRRDEEL